MDMTSLMGNPMMGQLIQRLQANPDLMQRMQGLMSNPAGAQQAMANDPEMQEIMQQFMGGGGGGGGMGGGMGGMGGGGMGEMGGMGGGFGNNPWGSPAPAAPAASASSSASSSAHAYVDIHSDSQYASAVASAGKRLVVVDVTASWCGPCKRIAPVFTELSNDYRGRAVFLKVDGDENPSLMRQLGCNSYPTFIFLVDGKEVDRFGGADERRLRANVSQHGDVEEAKVCPYKHFPLREAEQVSFKEMKWEAVEGKLDEYNAVVGETQRMSELERAEVDVVIQKLQNKLNYHSATFSDAQHKLIRKVSPHRCRHRCRHRCHTMPLRAASHACRPETAVTDDQLAFAYCLLCVAVGLAEGVRRSSAEPGAAIRAAPERGREVQQRGCRREASGRRSADAFHQTVASTQRLYGPLTQTLRERMLNTMSVWPLIRVAQTS